MWAISELFGTNTRYKIIPPRGANWSYLEWSSVLTSSPNTPNICSPDEVHSTSSHLEKDCS
jgi:hypothetical protein